jgi:hypothetical protein
MNPARVALRVKQWRLAIHVMLLLGRIKPSIV